MGQGWRSASRDDFQAMDTLCAEGFGLSQGQSFFDDFPIWDIRLPFTGRWIEIAENRDQLVAQLGAIERQNLTESRPLTMVGAVVTRASEQGRGLARSGLSHLISKTESHGARSWVLWTGDDRLYRSMGFEPFGRQWRTTISKIAPQSIAGAKIGRGWRDDFTGFLATRTRGLRMSEPESEMLRNLANVDWWSLRGSDGVLQAVVGIGKGIDLGGIAHDWHGSETALRALLGEIAKELPQTTLLYGEALFAFHPWLRQLEPEFEDPLCYWRGIAPSKPNELWFWGCDSC